VLLLVLELVALGAENLLDFPLSVPRFRRVTGLDYLDMCVFCSADQVYAHLDGFGAIGRTMQLLLYSTIDVVIPTLSGLFGALGIAYLTRARRVSRPQLGWLVVIPITAALLDFTENALIAILLSRYPARMEPLATVTGLVTGLKTSAYLLTAVTLAAFGLLGLRRGTAAS